MSPQCEFCWGGDAPPQAAWMWHTPETHTDEHRDQMRERLGITEEEQ